MTITMRMQYDIKIIILLLYKSNKPLKYNLVKIEDQ